MDGEIAIEEHFVTPELEDLVLNPRWPPEAFRKTLDTLEDVDVVNGYSNGCPYYDDERYWRFWEALEALGVPLYLHPRNPLESMREISRGPEGAEWFDVVAINEDDQLRIAHGNAEALLGLAAGQSLAADA